MPRYPNGQPVRLTETIKDVTGALTNAGALSLVLTKPDLTTQTYSSPTNDSTGLYHQDLAAADLSQNGHYQYVWTATGTGAGVNRGDLDVFDPLEPVILSLQDAKDAVNIAQTTSSFDNELQVYVDTVTILLEQITGGPAYNRSISERLRVRGDLRSVSVRYRPLVSVTSMTDIATSTVMPITDLDIDPVTGIIRRKLGLAFWSRGIWYQVVYVAGWGTQVPPAFNAAARIILQHLWETQLGPGIRSSVGVDPTGMMAGMAYAIPPRALEIMRPYTLEAYV